MKMIYISSWDMDPKGNNTGSVKKTLAQIKAFNTFGIDTVLFNEFNIVRDFFIYKLIKRLPYTSVYNKLKYSDKLNGADFYYIRFLGSDYHFYRFIKKLHKNNLKAKIIIELPDVDYMSHFEKNLKNIPFFIKDKICFYHLKKYVDKLVIMGKYKTYLGIECINIYNGIDTSCVKVRKSKIVDSKTINLGAVASIQPCHGYDLMINGLYEYYLKKKRTTKVVFHIVGGGPELTKLKDLVNQYKLNKFVYFYGFKFDNDLDNLYNLFDIGICEMAPWRRGFEFSSSLKSREYLAKGLPIITSSKIDIFDKKTNKFQLVLPENKEYVDIESCIKYYHDLYVDGDDNRSVIDEIRCYAEQTIDMKITILPIVNYIQEYEITKGEKII